MIKQNSYFSIFLKERLNKEKFSGRSLTLLFIIFLGALFLFLVIADSITTIGRVVITDIQVANFLFDLRTAELISFFTWITLLGKWPMVMGGIIIASLIMWLWSRRMYIFPLWISLISSELFIILGKIVFHRPRPEIAYYMENSFSFPSGHATMAVAFYGFLMYVFYQEIKNWGYKVAVIFDSLLLIFVIGFSRLYLGVHHLSDVEAGYLLGLLSLVIAITLSEWQQAKHGKPEPIILSPKTKFISAMLILVVLGFYIVFGFYYHPPLTSFLS